MRTTIDLPADLMRSARTQAAAQGETLKELFARAIAHEVELPTTGRTRTRVTLPLIGAGARPTVNVTNADIETTLAADDAERSGR